MAVNYKVVISKNLNYLMSVCNTSRKEFCRLNSIKYTTLCDWLSGKSYPRIETLERIATKFELDLPDMFLEIEANAALTKRLSEYARRVSMVKDYSSTYPEGFFELFGALKGVNIEAPGDVLPEEPETQF